MRSPATESDAARLGPEALAAAAEAAPDGFAGFDADWAIRYVNPAGARLRQHTQDELMQPASGHLEAVAAPWQLPYVTGPADTRWCDVEP